MKRIASLILICCLAMALSVGAYAATSYTGGLALDETTVEQGKTVDVTMSLPVTALATVQFGIAFDTAYLEVTAIDAPGAEDMEGFGLYAASEIAAANENGLLTFAYVGAKGENVLQFGENVITVTFKALKTGETTVAVAGDEGLPLIMENLKDDGYTPKTQYAPSKKAVALTIEEPAYVVGDVNMDGEVDIMDANLMIQQIVGNTEFDSVQMSLYDVNGDGEGDIMDANQIIQYVVGNRTSLY